MVIPSFISRIAGRVDVVDLIGEVAESSGPRRILLVPIIGEFDPAARHAPWTFSADLRLPAAHKNTSVNFAFLVVDAADLLQSKAS